MVIGNIIFPDFIEFKCGCGKVFELNHLQYDFDDLGDKKRIYYGHCPDCYREVEKNVEHKNTV